MAACTQLRLASVLVGDLRRPWHKRPEPGQVLSPYRVRLGFRRLRAQLGTPGWDGEKHPARPGPSQGVEEPAQDPPPIYRKSDNKHTTHSRATKQDP